MIFSAPPALFNLKFDTSFLKEDMILNELEIQLRVTNESLSDGETFHLSQIGFRDATLIVKILFLFDTIPQYISWIHTRPILCAIFLLCQCWMPRSYRKFSLCR